MENKQPIKVLIAGFGQRGMDPYGIVIRDNPGKMQLCAIADPDPRRQALARKQFGDSLQCFATGEEMLSLPRFADIVIVSVQDRYHHKLVIAALEKGYHVLVEKPIAPSLDECLDIAAKAKQYDRNVYVCHVLRYTPFYTFIKKAILDGEIGDFVSVQQTENVGYWHQAHSFVRGNWRNSKESAPMILTKSCHDLDIILWLTGKNCVRVSSFGGLYHFREEQAPEGSTVRCVDCPMEECPYNATEIYMNSSFGYRSGHRGWPLTVLTEDLDTDEKILEAIRSGPYGRCVYRCDNDVVDHQVVNMEFEDNVTASFTMCAFNNGGARSIKIMGTRGDIIGDMEQNTIRIQQFGKPARTIDINKLGLDMSGHAGGDRRMLLDIADILMNPDASHNGLTSIDYSVQSHEMAFAAEKSRLAGGVPVSIRQEQK
ncbi:MAG: Gfo/Idh/MocA family protein [Saccharofermentanales bacterium]